MKIYVKIAGLVALLLALHAGVYAQGNVKQLRLKECVALALENNVRMKNARLEQTKMQYQINQVRGSGFPQIKITGDFQDMIDIPVQMIPGEFFDAPGTYIPVKFGVQYSMSGGVEVSQLVYSQTFFTALQVSRKAMETKALNLQKTREELIYEVSQLYYSIQVAKEQLKNLQDNQNKLDTLYSIVALQKDFGFAKPVDVDRVKVVKMNLVTNIENITVLLNQQKNLLKFYTGINIQSDIDVEDENLNESTIKLPDFQPEHHVDMKLLNNQSELAQLNIKYQQASYYPSLVAFGQFRYQSMADEFNFMKSNSKWFRTSIVGLSLNIPVFTGFQTRYKVQQSLIELEQLELQKANSKMYLGIEYDNALQKFDNSRKALDRQAENVKLAEDVYKVTNELYQKGLSPLTDLLNAESALHDARTVRLQAYIQNRLAELDLKKASGKLEIN